MTDDGYTMSAEDDGTGEKEYLFRGPGMPNYANRVVASEFVAKRVQNLLTLAFEAGRKAKAKEIRSVLGVTK